MNVITRLVMEPDFSVPAQHQVPRQEWLPVSSLRVDPSFQREITKAGETNIRNIARQFSWAKFSPVIVTPAHDGLFLIIDGQHRTSAALTCGFGKVPAYIVKVDLDEAARVFSAVNGNVTKMSRQQILKAALAGKEPWALAVAKACDAAGVTPLLYPVQTKKQAPLSTMAAGALEAIAKQHGGAVLAVALRCLAAAKGANIPGFLTTKLIRTYSRMVAANKPWLKHLETVVLAFENIDVNGETPDQVIAKVNALINRPKTLLEASKPGTIEDAIRDLDRRHFSKQAICAKLHVPYREVEKVLGARS